MYSIDSTNYTPFQTPPASAPAVRLQNANPTPQVSDYGPWSHTHFPFSVAPVLRFSQNRQLSNAGLTYKPEKA